MRDQKLKTEKHAALYVRVSTEMQAERDSLKTQQERLIELCHRNGVSKFEVYIDSGVSGKDTNRPALIAILDGIRAGLIHSVYVTKLDRLTRSLSDQLELTKFFASKNILLIASDQEIDTISANGRFRHGLTGLLAQHEREVTSERVAIDMRHRATQGEWNGGVVPFGYTTQSLLIRQFEESGLAEGDALLKAARICSCSKKLTIYEPEADIVRWMFNTYLKCNSIRKTTTLLSDQGIKTRNGEWWATSSVQRILSSTVYVGMICYGKRSVNLSTGKLVNQEKSSWTRAEGNHAPIISQNIFDGVQEMLKNKAFKPRKKGRPYLLTGIIKCALCGGSMCGQETHKKGNKKSYAYYKCVNHRSKGPAVCKGLSLPALAVEEFVIQQLMDLSKNKSFFDDREKMMALYQQKIDGTDTFTNLNKLDGVIEGAKKRLNRLMDKLENGLIDDDDFKPRYQTLKMEITESENKMIKLETIAALENKAAQNQKLSFEEIASFSRGWKTLSENSKAKRIRSIVSAVKATKETLDMDIFMAVDNLSRMDRDSLPQRA